MLFLRLFVDKPNVELFFHFASGQEADIPTCTPPNSPPHRILLAVTATTYCINEEVNDVITQRPPEIIYGQYIDDQIPLSSFSAPFFSSSAPWCT